MIIIIEKITFKSLFDINKISKKNKFQTNDFINILYIEKHSFFMQSIFLIFYPKLRINKLSWNYITLLDQSNSHIGMRVIYKDLGNILDKLFSKKNYNLIKSSSNNNFFQSYIKKRISTEILTGSNKTLIKILIMFNAMAVYSTSHSPKQKIFFIINNFIFIKEIEFYLKELNLKNILINNSIDKKINFKKIFLSNIFINFIEVNLIKLINYKIRFNNQFNNTKIINTIIDQPINFFDLKNSWKKNILNLNRIIFVSKTHSINLKEYKNIINLGAKYIELGYNFFKNIQIPFFLKVIQNYKKNKLSNNNLDDEEYINETKKDYINEYNHWKNLFNLTDTKIYITSHKWSSHVLPASHAIKDFDGVSAVFQTSYEIAPTPYSSVYSDIYFSFSQSNSNFKNINSKYSITVGYLKDFLFEDLKSSAKILKSRLLSNGAKKIISFFDQASTDDKRWFRDHSILNKEYKFWLENLINNEWLGIIIKPVYPGLIRKNLGDLSNLLDQAIQTGRCHILEEKDDTHRIKNFATIPAFAAMASDLSIHDMLTAPTAGIEAALTGTPTLLFDNFRYQDSNFNELEKNKVIFYNWNDMWNASKNYLTHNSIQGFGQWSSIINKIDPFRDGKAFQRMSNYINYLSEGFNNGKSRDIVMKEAAISYSNEWGEDKIITRGEL